MVRVRQIISGILVSGLWGSVSFAQSFSAEPIAFDLDATSDATGTPVLIAAYQPPTAAVPSFASANQDRSASTTDAGLPTPSIILGRVEPGREADFGISTLLPDTVEEFGFSYTDVEARNALRGSDPDLLRQLINEGHLDPPEDQLLVALQTELQRMNCYRSTIDGLWGRGSARAVSDYFSESAGNASSAQEPSMGLFREIIISPDVECEVPQAAPARTTSNRSAAPRPTATTTRRAPAPAAPKPAAPKPAAKPKISSGGGIGVFR